MGTHARTGMVEWALGSIAHKVQTCAPCPVITLRGDEPPAHP
jgi:nucleotide-binding universal stress UspA family protein